MSSRAVSIASLLCALSTAGCDQPKPKCTVAHGSFAATFKLVSGEGPCAELTSGVLDVQSYYAPMSDSNQVLDPNKPTLAIQTQDTTDALSAGRETDPDTRPFALGAFDRSQPDADGICSASSLSKAVIKAPATEGVPEMMIDECTVEPAQPAQPAIDASYAWRNVRVVVTPAAIGTKLSADLEYTIDGCTARYKVAAVWPLVECGSAVAGSEPPAEEPAAGDEDAGVDPGASECPIEEQEPPPPELEPDDELCQDQGAIPDFPVRCDPALLLCVLDE